MSSWSTIVERARGLDLERALGLRPVAPRVAVELDRHEFSLVRVKRKRRDKPLLEVHRVHRLEDAGVPATIFDNGLLGREELAEPLRELFEAAGIRPGRVTLVLPDNLAKVSLLTLPERPPSRKQLLEIIRFKMRRAVPFRLNEASLAYQVLPGAGPETVVLVALIRRSILEQYERALESLGARPGLVDLSTPNVLNLCRDQVDRAAASGGDVALLNCTPSYFSLVIVRRSRLIFFRCKTYSLNAASSTDSNGLLGREVASSFSYYHEKLAGRGIRTLLVRTVSGSFDEIRDQLQPTGVERLELIAPADFVELGEGQRLEIALAQRIAPALGAAIGRGG